MTTHEILVAARNILDRDGWVQRDFGELGTPRCALGAVAGADDTRGFIDAKNVLHRTVGGDVIEWNNKPGRTKAEVLAAFDRAIAATAPAPADPFPVGRASFREPISA